LTIRDINSILNRVNGPLGEDDFIEPLSILLSDYKNASEFNALGQFSMHQTVLSQLKNRSKLYQFVDNKNLPKVSNPIIVSGLPRSGTTFLFDLLHCDISLRGPLTWEIFQMMPITNSGINKTTKVFKTKMKLLLIKALMPDLMRMHAMSAYLPEECQQIMSIDFKSISWAYNANVPESEAFLKTGDYTSAILWHSRFLQALETAHKPKNWLLKDPCHIQHIPELLKIYPGSKFIFIHRDPVDTIPSISSLTSHLRSPFAKNIDTVEIGINALSFWKNAIDCFLEDRKLIARDNYVDINFKDFIAAPLEQILAAYQSLGLEVSQQNKTQMKDYIDKQSSKKITQHKYTLKDFGLSQKQVEDSFQEYRMKFDL
jgi:hypothetical protein